MKTLLLSFVVKAVKTPTEIDCVCNMLLLVIGKG